MLRTLLLGSIFAVSLCLAAQAQEETMPRKIDSPKILIAFFSKTNNTRTVAEQIHAAVGGTLFQVTTKNPYPSDYRQTTDIAKKEQNDNVRPELAATIPPEEMTGYDIIFVGYPIWWGTMPMAMFTFLEQYDLSGKVIFPFCSHGGSGLARGPDDIKKLCPDTTVLPGLAIRSADRAQKDVADWLAGLNITH